MKSSSGGHNLIVHAFKFLFALYGIFIFIFIILFLILQQIVQLIKDFA
jgi:hypothetical protein